MIPYRADDTDDPTQAIPVVTIGLIVANFLVFFYELALSTQGSQLDNFINAYSLVPCEYTQHCAVYAGTPSPFWITLLSSMFMHAGWAHILGNMLFFICLRPSRRKVDGRRSLPRLLFDMRPGRKRPRDRDCGELKRSRPRRQRCHSRSAGRVPGALPNQPREDFDPARDRLLDGADTGVGLYWFVVCAPAGGRPRFSQQRDRRWGRLFCSCRRLHLRIAAGSTVRTVRSG